MAYRPGYNNANQAQATQADKILDSKVNLLMEKYLEVKINIHPKFIGAFQGLPEGAILYEENGTLNIRHFRYSTTRFGVNFIFISIAHDEAAFLKIISEENFADNGLVKKDIILPSISIESIDFVTENDVDLSSIPDAYTVDLEDKRLKNKRKNE